MDQKSEIEPVEWYPGGRAWRLKEHTRWDLTDKEELKSLHTFIDEQRLSGNIYRQEIVSMVPVACLDVLPHHAVLDMCSSPGSKTCQVLEDVHAEPRIIPKGFVVANELDTVRCYNLSANVRLL